MALHTSISNKILSKGFTFVENNIYTDRQAYVKQIKNIETPDGRKFYNCSILLGTDSPNYIKFSIMRYHTTSEQLRDITREVFPGAYQFIPVDNIGKALLFLDQRPFVAATQYAL